MKRNLAWFLVITVLVLTGMWHFGGNHKSEASAPLTDERFCGDVNGDGALDVSDAVTLLSHIFGGPTDQPYCMAEGVGLDQFVTREELFAELQTLRESLPTVQEVAQELSDNHADELRGRAGPSLRVIDAEGSEVGLYLSGTGDEFGVWNRFSRKFLTVNRLTGEFSGIIAIDTDTFYESTDCSGLPLKRGHTINPFRMYRIGGCGSDPNGWTWIEPIHQWRDVTIGSIRNCGSECETVGRIIIEDLVEFEPVPGPPSFTPPLSIVVAE